MTKAHSFAVWPGILLLSLIAASSSMEAQTAFTADSQKEVDTVTAQVLAATGVPSASIAIVQNGQIVYAKAYGKANLETGTAARPEMRYCIGSISKQFTAAALLMLVEKRKVTLDDLVSKHIPGLTRGNEVTVRQLLSMTSGYQDFWPQDYVPPMMLKPITPRQILERWAGIPLDFDPGARWQYSNTNYTIAGLIIEKASHVSLMEFLQQQIFAPLHMASTVSMYVEKETATDPMGYLKYALGPPRPAPKEGKGWMFGAGELAMTASDLARWDISLINQTLLKPDSYRKLETEALLKSGIGTRYGLGISIALEQDRRVLSHGGEVSGFVAQNTIYPDDRAAIVVLTNLDASSAAGQIAKKIERVLFPEQDKDMEERLLLVRQIFDGMQHGRLDRSLLTANCNDYFSEQAVKDFADSLGPLGEPEEFTQTSHSKRGGMGFRAYTVKFKNRKAARITMRDMPDGRIEQYQVMASE
jgi:D-alanyl-D-alanine carboxypeptidase